jgi:hypothetical protein
MMGSVDHKDNIENNHVSEKNKGFEVANVLGSISNRSIVSFTVNVTKHQQ